LLQKANSGSNWRLSSEQAGGTECSFVYHVPGPRGISPGYLIYAGNFERGMGLSLASKGTGGMAKRY